MEQKEKIMTGAMELFMQYGVRSVTMDDVARELGMSKKTLYQSFANKEELIMETARTHIEQQKREFGEIHAEAENAIDELHRLTGCIRQSMQKVNPSLLYDLQKYHPGTWQLFVDMKFNFIHNHVRENIEKGIEEGVYRQNLNADILAKVRVEQVQACFNPKIFPPSEYNLVDVQISVLDHFIHGLLSEKGIVTFKKYQQTLNQ